MNPADIAWYNLIADYLESRATPEVLEHVASALGLNETERPSDEQKLSGYVHSLASALGFYEARNALRYELNGTYFVGTAFGEWGQFAYISAVAHRHLANGVCSPPQWEKAPSRLTYMQAFKRFNAEDETEYYCVDVNEWAHEEDCVFTRHGVAYHMDSDIVSYCESCGNYEEDTCILVDSRGRDTGECICSYCVDRSEYRRVEHRDIDSACASERDVVWVEGTAHVTYLVQDNAGSCDSCNDMFWLDNMTSNDRGMYCNGCYEDRRSYKIKGRHDSDPTSLGWFSEDSVRMSRTTRYYGFELEVEPRKGHDIHTIAEHDLDAIDGWTTLEEDGSLDAGCEIISAPHTLARMRERFQDLGSLETWNRALKHCRSHDTTTCGLHVHVSRVDLPRDMGTRLQSFMAKEGNSRFLDVIAQRKANDYCLRIVSESQRFCAVNLTNDDTIEFRLFKGNIRADRVLKAIEFCDALLAYLAREGVTFAWQGFVVWLSERVTRYPVLCSYLMERGIQVSEDYAVATQPGLPGLEEATQADPGLAALLAINYDVVDLDPVHAP